MRKQNRAHNSCKLPLQPLCLFSLTLYISGEARKDVQKEKGYINMN